MIFYGSEPMVFTNFIYFTKLKDFKMEIVQIIVSIITLIGVLSASIFSFLATRSSNKFAKTSKYIDVITSQRILWLDKIRDDTADMISSMKQFASEDIILESENEKNDRFVVKDHEKEIIKKINILILRLNLLENQKLILLLKDLESSLLVKKSDDVLNITEDILIETQVILKNEWEKVKEEVFFPIKKRTRDSHKFILRE